MRLEDCVLEEDVFYTAPLVRTEPEKEWVQARDSGAIPLELYGWYERAQYLSFGSSLGFLGDADNILFSYFGMLMRSVMESSVDSVHQVQSFVDEQKLTYDVGKKLRGETWDEGADVRSRRHFRDLLIALQTSLDGLADMIALFFTGRVPRLNLGRAQFVRVEEWLKRPLPPFGLIATPYDEPLRQLFDVLGPLVNTAGSESEWLPLMRMLRNKASHLGQPVFRQIGLHDKTLKFYTFIPRQWPYIWERHMKPKEPSPYGPDFIPNFFRETLIHQDVETYAIGLQRKVLDVVRAGISVLAETYGNFQDFAPNTAALAELQGNSESFSFERFSNA
jgi:hypothetical protein